jgi:DNA-binding NtrC family response regulator
MTAKVDLLALLVDGKDGGFRALEQTLHSVGIRTQRVHTCSEARAALREPGPSRLILTATALSDGTWADVLELANMHGRAVPVIVVSRFVDVGLYLKALESGASDFIVPPFLAADVAFIVHTTIAKSSLRHEPVVSEPPFGALFNKRQDQNWPRPEVR